jgi:hypothetical protein
LMHTWQPQKWFWNKTLIQVKSSTSSCRHSSGVGCGEVYGITLV